MGKRHIATPPGEPTKTKYLSDNMASTMGETFEKKKNAKLLSLNQQLETASNSDGWPKTAQGQIDLVMKTAVGAVDTSVVSNRLKWLEDHQTLVNSTKAAETEEELNNVGDLY